MKVEPAKIPQANQGKNFKVPDYDPKEVVVFGEKSLTTENYPEEVDLILDKDKDGYDKDGNYVKDKSGVYIQYNEEDKIIAKYFNTDNDYGIEQAEYYELDEDGNEIGKYYDDDNDGNIDKAEYYELDENGNKVAIFYDYDNGGIIDMAEYLEYDKKGNATFKYTDVTNDGNIEIFTDIEKKISYSDSYSDSYVISDDTVSNDVSSGHPNKEVSGGNAELSKKQAKEKTKQN